MAIFKRELFAHAKAWFIWALSLAAFIVVMFTEFSAYYKNPEMAELIDVMPKALLDAFGMKGVNLTTLSGFTSVAFVYLLLMLSIYAVLLGNGILSKEERDKTTEFLMVLPVKRTRVITSKVIAALSLNLALCVAVGLVITLSSLPYEADPAFSGFFVRMLAVMLMISTSFLTIGMALAAATKNYKRSSMLSVAIVILMYLLSIISGLHSSVNFLKAFSFFKYFEGHTLIQKQHLDAMPIFILLLVASCALGVIYYRYPRRDLHT